VQVFHKEVKRGGNVKTKYLKRRSYHNSITEWGRKFLRGERVPIKTREETERDIK